MLVTLTHNFGIQFINTSNKLHIKSKKIFASTKYHVTNRESLLQHTPFRTKRTEVCIT